MASKSVYSFYIDQRLYLSKDAVLKIKSKPCKRTNKNACLKGITKNVGEYFSSSTIHGFKYISESKTFAERVFWLTACIFAVTVSCYFIYQIYYKYNMSPVIMTLSPVQTPTSQVPFPAITVCGLNKAKRSLSDRIQTDGSRADRDFLDDVCNFKSTIKEYTEETGKFVKYYNFLNRVSPSCGEMMKLCTWHNEIVECSKLFRQIITDEGLCCTFNQLPLKNLFKDSQSHRVLKDKFFSDVKVDNWNSEKGYSSNASKDTYPFRSEGSGANLGLSIVLDSEVDDYFCSSANCVGFKVQLHTPVELARMSDYSFMIHPGLNYRLIFKPIVHKASFAIKGIDIKKRNCYFQGERILQNLKIYNQVNCKMECLANVTLKECGCVAFYLPANSSLKICGKREEECYVNIKQDMELNVKKYDNWCNCKPTCFKVEYDKFISAGKFDGDFQIGGDMLSNLTMPYISKNVALVRFFYVDSSFQTYIKSELYGFSEFLSNTGGLLGLFLGFSFLSVVEVVYFFTIRIFCNFVQIKRKKKHINFSRNEDRNIAIKGKPPFMVYQP